MNTFFVTVLLFIKQLQSAIENPDIGKSMENKKVEYITVYYLLESCNLFLQWNNDVEVFLQLTTLL